jgi:hypothetical protein
MTTLPVATSGKPPGDVRPRDCAPLADYRLAFVKGQ